jgi:hypothetical protein
VSLTLLGTFFTVMHLSNIITGALFALQVAAVKPGRTVHQLRQEVR